MQSENRLMYLSWPSHFQNLDNNQRTNMSTYPLCVSIDWADLHAGVNITFLASGCSLNTTVD